MYRQAEDCTEA